MTIEGRVRVTADEILCDNEALANSIADWIEDADKGKVWCATGYYDPVEDAKNGCVDERTGWWYVIV